MAIHFKRKGKKILGLDRQDVIRFFFGGNAMISIFVLGAICLFLLREAVLFFPQHQRDLEVFRLSGQEYARYVIDEVDEHTELKSLANQAYFQEMNEAFGTERGLYDSYGALVGDIYDEGEDLADSLEEARDQHEAAAGEGISAATAELKNAQDAWDNFYKDALANVERSSIDSFDRLDDASWNRLIEAMREWDPIEDTPPALVSEAKARLDEKLAVFDTARMKLGSAATELSDLRNELTKITTQIKEEAVADQSAAARKQALEEGIKNAKSDELRERLQTQADAITIRQNFPFADRIKALEGSREKHEAAVQAMFKDLDEAVAMLPTKLESKGAEPLILRVKDRYPNFKNYIKESLQDSKDWKFDESIGIFTSIGYFFLGRDWVTNSSFHDFYGLLPLFVGSFLISVIALLVALPFSIGAAIYVNRIAGPIQQNFIKPIIELIGAIPSVVLGFFGIMVLGEALRDASQLEWLSWVPGFPMRERLNILNAGLLLALMAVPTIFTLCEDALNNVPKSFYEASLALGGSKLQTVLKIVIPTAMSGIVAAVLLGFGRVIGETMVVLLVAGNQISIPDFGLGLGVITEPTHTMTGIIAQEMGEVTKNTIHYRALFSVGLILFTISLLINISARKIIRRFGITA